MTTVAPGEWASAPTMMRALDEAFGHDQSAFADVRLCCTVVGRSRAGVLQHCDGEAVPGMDRCPSCLAVGSL